MCSCRTVPLSSLHPLHHQVTVSCRALIHLHIHRYLFVAKETWINVLLVRILHNRCTNNLLGECPLANFVWTFLYLNAACEREIRVLWHVLRSVTEVGAGAGGLLPDQCSQDLNPHDMNVFDFIFPFSRCMPPCVRTVVDQCCRSRNGCRIVNRCHEEVQVVEGGQINCHPKHSNSYGHLRGTFTTRDAGTSVSG